LKRSGKAVRLTEMLANFVDNNRILHGNVTMESRSFIVENDIDAGKGIGGKMPINLLTIVRFVFAQEIIEIQHNERNASYVAFAFVGLHLALSLEQIITQFLKETFIKRIRCRPHSSGLAPGGFCVGDVDCLHFAQDLHTV